MGVALICWCLGRQTGCLRLDGRVDSIAKRTVRGDYETYCISDSGSFTVCCILSLRVASQAKEGAAREDETVMAVLRMMHRLGDMVARDLHHSQPRGGGPG